MKILTVLFTMLLTVNVYAQNPVELWTGDVRVVEVLDAVKGYQSFKVASNSEEHVIPLKHQDSLQIQVNDVICTAVGNSSKLVGEFTTMSYTEFENYGVVTVVTPSGLNQYKVSLWYFVNDFNLDLRTDPWLVEGETFRLVEVIGLSGEKRFAVMKRF